MSLKKNDKYWTENSLGLFKKPQIAAIKGFESHPTRRTRQLNVKFWN